MVKPHGPITTAERAERFLSERQAAERAALRIDLQQLRTKKEAAFFAQLYASEPTITKLAVAQAHRAAVQAIRAEELLARRQLRDKQADALAARIARERELAERVAMRKLDRAVSRRQLRGATLWMAHD